MTLFLTGLMTGGGGRLLSTAHAFSTLTTATNNCRAHHIMRTARCGFPSTATVKMSSMTQEQQDVPPPPPEPTPKGKKKKKQKEELPPLYLAQGLFAVDKPPDWTSSDVVSYLRGILERDARQRGAKPAKALNQRQRRRKIKASQYSTKRKMKVGHGGTLDPMATGVLVIGVGSGTKKLHGYLHGSKRYTAGLELGYETSTLDMTGNITDAKPFDHVTLQAMQDVVPNFIGVQNQVPPIYSAIRIDGRRLYERAREGATEQELGIQPRRVEIHSLSLENTDNFPPKLDIDVRCGGGMYVRSLIRDLGYAVDSCATTMSLRRTQQGPFSLADCLAKDDWTAENIYAALDKFNADTEANAETVDDDDDDDEDNNEDNDDDDDDDRDSEKDSE